MNWNKSKPIQLTCEFDVSFKNIFCWLNNLALTWLRNQKPEVEAILMDKTNTSKGPVFIIQLMKGEQSTVDDILDKYKLTQDFIFSIANMPYFSYQVISQIIFSIGLRFKFDVRHMIL